MTSINSLSGSQVSYLLQSMQRRLSANSASNTGSTPGVADSGGVSAGAQAGSMTMAGQTTAALDIGSLPLDPSTFSGLLQAQEQQGGSGSLFANLDTNGDGEISKSEMETAFTANGSGSVDQADDLFNKLDGDRDGSVSQSELAAAAPQHHRHHGGGGGGLLSALSGDSASGTDTSASAGSGTQTMLNADGSSTVTVTNADGSTFTYTVAADNFASMIGSDGTDKANDVFATQSGSDSKSFLSMMIELQSQMSQKQPAAQAA